MSWFARSGGGARSVATIPAAASPFENRGSGEGDAGHVDERHVDERHVDERVDGEARTDAGGARRRCSTCARTGDRTCVAGGRRGARRRPGTRGGREGGFQAGRGGAGEERAVRRAGGASTCATRRTDGYSVRERRTRRARAGDETASDAIKGEKERFVVIASRAKTAIAIWLPACRSECRLRAGRFFSDCLRVRPSRNFQKTKGGR